MENTIKNEPSTMTTFDWLLFLLTTLVIGSTLSVPKYFALSPFTQMFFAWLPTGSAVVWLVAWVIGKRKFSLFALFLNFLTGILLALLPHLIVWVGMVALLYNLLFSTIYWKQDQPKETALSISKSKKRKEPILIATLLFASLASIAWLIYSMYTLFVPSH